MEYFYYSQFEISWTFADKSAPITRARQ